MMHGRKNIKLYNIALTLISCGVFAVIFKEAALFCYNGKL